MFQTRGSRRFRKSVALVGAVAVGASLFVGVSQTGSASAAAVKAGCGKTTLPWFFDKDGDGDSEAHYYTETPKADRSNAKPCSDEQIKAAGGNLRVGDGSSGNGTDTVESRQEGGSESNPFPPNKSLKATPDGCQDKNRKPRVWKYIGSKGPKGWYECHPDQIKDDAGKADGVTPAEDPAPAAAKSEAELKQAIAHAAYKHRLATAVSYKKAKYSDTCKAGYTPRDSQRTTDVEWKEPNNGWHCNLVKWSIWLAGAQKQSLPDLKATYKDITGKDWV